MLLLPFVNVVSYSVSFGPKYDYRLLIDRALIRYFKYAVFMYMIDNRLKDTI